MVAGSPPEALYIHVPFCRSLCPYCDFVVYTGRAARGPGSRIEVTLAALHVELDLRADAADARFGPPGAGRPPLRSIYLGGGTPSLLPAAAVAGLLEHAAARFGLAADGEITLETNPGEADRGDLPGFRSAGVTRLSVGAQSLDAAELRRIGRRHRPADVVETVRLARRAGFASLSLDLLTDLPDQSVASWERTLRVGLALEPDHLSMYALTLDDPDSEGLTGTLGDHLPLRPGARRWRERARPRQDEDRAAAMEEATDRLAGEAGLERYEIANLARPGHRSRHNLAYWERRPYEAVGPGAHAFDGCATRRWTAARLDAYLAALLGTPPRLPPGGHETLPPEQVTAERAILGLRLTDGIDGRLAHDRLLAPALEWARTQGLVEHVVDRVMMAGRPRARVRLTARGRLLANEVFARLLPPSAAGPGARG
jgi:oxygen-independent coproporphyrinogen-3 oxidase